MAITTANSNLLPNGLGDIAPNLYTSVEEVAREMTGAIRAVTINTGEGVAALGSQITSFRTRAREARDTQAGHTPDDVDAQQMDTLDLRITKSRTVPIKYTDDEMANFEQGDSYGFQAVLANDIKQAFRTLTNEVDKEIVDTMVAERPLDNMRGSTALFASTAAPTAGTAGARRHFNTMGAPMGDRCLIIGHKDAEALMANASLAKINESGTDDVLRDGMIARIGGFNIYESHHADSLAVAASTLHASQKVNETNGAAKYATSFAIDGGTGAAPAGSAVKIGDYNYILDVARASASITIRYPGLFKALADDADIDSVAAHNIVLGLHKSAFELAIRAPSRPRRDNARDVMVVRDPTGTLAFEVAEYAEHRQHYWEVTAVWGMKAWQPEWVAGVQTA